MSSGSGSGLKIREREIRTHGAMTPAGFQARSLKPLGQLSKFGGRWTD